MSIPVRSVTRSPGGASDRDEPREGLYERDILQWSEQQAALLRAGQCELLDLDNLAEEIESLGKLQIAALRASYRLIAMHLLKLMLQPERATASWENTINCERSRVVDLVDDSPGLKPRRAALFAEAYAAARSEAAFETRIALDRFPSEAPFTLEQLENRAFWPPGFPRSDDRTDEHQAAEGAGRPPTSRANDSISAATSSGASSCAR